MSVLVFVAICVLLIFFYKTNNAFKFYLKLFFYMFCFCLIEILALPVFIVRPKDPRNLVVIAQLLQIITPLLGLKYKLIGQENLKKYDSYVVVSNHQSILDILGMAVCLPIMKNCALVAKKEISRIGISSIIGLLGGVIFIQRTYSEETKTALNKTLERIKEKKYKLWFYPEGGCYNTGEIHSFKKGAFHLAVNAGIPIVPIVSSQLKWFDRERKKFDSGTVIMKILSPVLPSDFSTVDELMKNVRTSMVTSFQDMQTIS